MAGWQGDIWSANFLENNEQLLVGYDFAFALYRFDPSNGS
jgi:hypothetical protein